MYRLSKCGKGAKSKTVTPKHKITFDADGVNGKLTVEVNGKQIASGAEEPEGTTVKFTAALNKDYEVEAWTVTGGAFSAGGTAEVKVGKADLTVKVKFKGKSSDSGSELRGTWRIDIFKDMDSPTIDKNAYLLHFDDKGDLRVAYGADIAKPVEARGIPSLFLEQYDFQPGQDGGGSRYDKRFSLWAGCSGLKYAEFILKRKEG